MRFRANVDTGGLTEKLGRLRQDAAGIVRSALGEWAKDYRAKVQDRFDNGGPGWPPRKEQDAATQERQRGVALALARQRAEAKVRRKLARELRRAVKGEDALRVAGRFFVQKEFERVIRGGSAEHSLIAGVTAEERRVRAERSRITKALGQARKAKNAAAVATLKQRLAAFDERHADTVFSLGVKRVAKSIAGLAGRVERAEAKIQGKPLGRIASSIVAKVTGSTVTVESKVPWAGVHNEGGSVGKGASLPARPFLFLEESDLELLRAILRARMAAALNGERDG